METRIKDIIENLPDYGKEWEYYLKNLDNVTDPLLQYCYVHSYCNYIDLHIIHDLRESKVASKPMWYKVVKDFVESYSNDIVRTYLSVDKPPFITARISHSLHTSKYNKYGNDPTYLSNNDNGSFDYARTSDLCFQMPIDPNDIEKEYKELERITENYKKEFDESHRNYTERFNSHSNIGYPLAYVSFDECKRYI